MQGQMSIFDFIESGFTTWDDDINFINSELDRIATRNGYQVGNHDFHIWGHVPEYGYRLTHETIITRGNPNERRFCDDLEALTVEAKKRGVELSPMWQGVFFYNGDAGRLWTFTTFLDGRRKKRGY